MMIAVAILAVWGGGQTLDTSKLKPDPTFTNGLAAYVYGYPLVMFGTTEKFTITVPNAITKLGNAPLNQFGKE